jgi:hypothetical protein
MGYGFKYSNAATNIDNTLRKVNTITTGGHAANPSNSFKAGVNIISGKHTIARVHSSTDPEYWSLTDNELIRLVTSLGQTIYGVTGAINYIQSQDDFFYIDNVAYDNSVLEDIELNFQSNYDSSFVNNDPITNIVSSNPAMTPTDPTAFYQSTSTSSQSNVGGSGWTWSFYPNSNVSSDGGMEWNPNLEGPYGQSGVWIMKKRPGGNSESNWSTTAPGTVDETKAWTISVWCKTTQASCFRTHLNVTKNGASNWGYASTQHSGDGTWQRLVFTIPANSGVTSINVIRCQANGTTITADAQYKYYQVEEGVNATDFVDGTRSQNTYWDDLSGNSKNGTLTNGVTFKPSGYMDFDGADDYCAIDTYTFGNGNWTVNALVAADTVQEHNLVSNTSGGPVTNAFGFDNSKIHYRNYDGSWQNHDGNTTLTTGTWYMLTWVNYAGASAAEGTMKMYVNGIADSSVFNSYTTNGGPCDAIGRNWGSTEYDGKIANIQFYSKSLTDAEISQNYFKGSIVQDNLEFAMDAGNFVSYESGSATMYSMTGSLNGELTNGVDFTFENGGSFTFDGTDDYINTGTFNMGTPTDITLECVIRFNGTLDSNDRKVVHYDKTGTTNAVFQLRKGTTNGTLMYQVHDGSSWSTLTDSDAIEADTWVHIIVTQEGTSGIMYKNGTQSATATMGNLYWTNANNLLIGYRAASEYWKGNISIMRIYSKALTPQEVQQNYIAIQPRFLS